MGILADAVKGATTEQIFQELYGGRQSKAGKNVNIETAARLSAVFGCLRVRGNGLAQVPLVLKQKNGRQVVHADKHPLYKLLKLKPNRWQTSFQWRQMASWHVDLTGNHYSAIVRNGNRVIELFPFAPDMVEKRELGRGTFDFEVTGEDGAKIVIPSADMLHLQGPTWNGWMGLEMINMARETIGLSLAAEESAAVLHKNGVNSSGVYTVEGKLDDEGHKMLSKWIDEHNSGPSNAGKPLILDRTAKWVSTQQTGKDSQSLETREHQISEVCRFYGVNPIMIGHTDKAQTFATAEQLFLAHITHCLAPMWTHFEQMLGMQLLRPSEIERGLYFDFNENAIIRGSIKDTKDTVLGYVNGGLLTPNEGREAIGENPIDDDTYDKLREPANITGNAPGSEGDRDNEGDENA